MPTVVYPELAMLVKKPPSGRDWLHEIKFDGYRILCFIKNKQIKLITRHQQDWSKKFPVLIKSLGKLKVETAIIDGELVALNKKQQSDFQLLQNAIYSKETSQLIYYVFDLIYYNGVDLSNLPLIDRKRELHQLISSEKGILRYSDHITGKGKSCFKKVCELNLEGIVSKKMNSSYIQKRSSNWVKIKCIKRQEFVIAGFTKPSGKRSYFGSLLLGIYDKNKKFVYCGHVGTGFTEASLKKISLLLEKSKTSKTPFYSLPQRMKDVTWVQPKMVAEIEFKEWTRDGILRQPSFKGIRLDKKPHDIVREKAISR